MTWPLVGLWFLAFSFRIDLKYTQPGSKTEDQRPKAILIQMAISNRSFLLVESFLMRDENRHQLIQTFGILVIEPS